MKHLYKYSISKFKMQRKLKNNIKYLKNKYPISNILNINEQSLKNKIFDDKRKFSIEDIILISKATNISLDDLVFSNLENC